MAWFAICEPYGAGKLRLISTGTVVDDAAVAANGYIKKPLAFDPQVPTKKWDDDLGDFVDVAAPKGKVDSIDFWKRFTVAEREDIFDAARGNTAAAKQLRGFIETHRQAGMINLDDQEIAQALARMETAELLAAGRAAAILG